MGQASLEAQSLTKRGAERPLFALAIVTAALQVGLSARLRYADDYQLTQALAWMAALWVTWDGRSELRASERRVAPLALVVGCTMAIATVVAMALLPRYRAVHRTFALVAGCGVAFAASGKDLWRQHRGALVVLGLPLINQPPKLLHRLFDPVFVPLTTWAAWGLNRAVGHPMIVDGDFLRMPNDSMEIVDGCSGLWAITRLCVLATLLICALPMTRRQQVALFLSAFAVGLVINAIRVAVLASAVLRGDDDKFRYWHQGDGATWFAIGASAAAGIVWWGLLHDRRRAAVSGGSGIKPA